MSWVLRISLSSLFLVGTGFLIGYRMLSNSNAKFLVMKKVGVCFWIFKKIVGSDKIKSEMSTGKSSKDNQSDQKHIVNVYPLLTSSELKTLTDLTDPDTGVFNKDFPKNKSTEIITIFKKIKDDALSS